MQLARCEEETGIVEEAGMDGNGVEVSEVDLVVKGWLKGNYAGLGEAGGSSWISAKVAFTATEKLSNPCLHSYLVCLVCF